MNIKKLVASVACFSILVGTIPPPVYATAGEALSDAFSTTQSEATNSIGQVGGYLSGNALTTAKLFAEHQFSNPSSGHAFAAERVNNLIDNLKGQTSSVVGSDNVKNGPDRMIVNRDGSITWIQDKYYASASQSVSSAFDETTGLYRYIDGDGRPMVLEVPSDQYDSAVKAMRKRIEAGKVPGVTDPDEAVNLIRKGNLTYKQAVNIAKAGTIESLTYDAASGAVVASCAVGISFVLDFAFCILNGQDKETALKNASLNGMKAGGVVFATYVISSQLAKTSAAKGAFIPTAEAIAKVLGEDVCEAIVKKTGVDFVGMTATKQVSHIIAKELLADSVMIIVLTTSDAIDLYRGRISKEELLKNLTVTIISIAAGTVGGYGGAVLGTILIAPGAGTAIGAVAASVASGAISAIAAEALIAPYYESDAEEMYAVIGHEFSQLCVDYFVSEEEANHIVDELSTTLTGNVLKDMYASDDRTAFAHDLLEPLFENEVKLRKPIVIPTAEEVRTDLKTSLQGILFLH